MALEEAAANPDDEKLKQKCVEIETLRSELKAKCNALEAEKREFDERKMCDFDLDTLLSA